MGANVVAFATENSLKGKRHFPKRQGRKAELWGSGFFMYASHI